MSFDRIFLSVVLFIFWGTFVATMATVRRRGHDPRGTAGGNTAPAVLNLAATVLWLFVLISYVAKGRITAWFGHLAPLDNSASEAAGIALSLLGLLSCVVGEATLGAAFRVALPREKTKLVTTGIYRYVRNPCALGADLFVLGTVLIAPSWLSLLAFILNLVGYEVKIRIEERHLRRVHGAAYKAYCSQTGRYIPKLLRGRRRGHAGSPSEPVA
jgi:protein-S-isoprenylcysteine O-methyltransferase Ste14